MFDWYDRGRDLITLTVTDVRLPAKFVINLSDVNTLNIQAWFFVLLLQNAKDFMSGSLLMSKKGFVISRIFENCGWR